MHATVRPYLSKMFVGPALQAWEIRPRLHWNKGSAVRLLLGKIDTDRPALVCAGDDATDEDMFSALRVSIPAAVTVWVAHDSPSSATEAEFSVADTDALRDLLSEIARLRRGEPFAKTG